MNNFSYHLNLFYHGCKNKRAYRNNIKQPHTHGHTQSVKNKKAKKERTMMHVTTEVMANSLSVWSNMVSYNK